MSEQWGPWIEHDGTCEPCRGQYAQWVRHNGVVLEGIAGSNRICFLTGKRTGFRRDGLPSAWIWRTRPLLRVIRYRIRKPRGLTILEGLLENLPERVDA